MDTTEAVIDEKFKLNRFLNVVDWYFLLQKINLIYLYIIYIFREKVLNLVYTPNYIKNSMQVTFFINKLYLINNIY